MEHRDFSKKISPEERRSFTIRTAKPEDLLALTVIYNQAITARQTADTVPLTTEDRLPWFNSHQQERYPILVLSNDTRTVGYGTLSQYRGGRPSLRNVVEVSYYLHQDFQGRGIGSLLLPYLLMEARKLDFKHAFALLLDNNLASVGLLEKFGFEQWGHFPNIAEIDGKTCGQYYYGKAL